MTIAEYISSGTFTPFKGGVVECSTERSTPLLSLNPKHLEVAVAKGVKAHLILLCTESVTASVEVRLAEEAELDMVELYLKDSHVAVSGHQSENSQLRSFSALLSSSNVGYTYALEGAGASNSLYSLYIATGSDHATINLNTRHNVGQCTSRSLIKGIAAGRATGEFRGLV